MVAGVKGPLDGNAVTYTFGEGHDRTTRWQVTATSLRRAVRLFRVGVLFPEQYAKKDGLVHIYLTIPTAEHRKEYTDVAQIPPEASAEEGDTEEITLRAATLLGVVEGIPGTALASRTGGPLQAARRTQLEGKMREIQAAQAALEKMRQELTAAAETLQGELKRRMEQLWIIELFLGSHEEVTVLREGTPAPEGTPITVRQAVLCMDEEISVHDWLHNPERIGTFDYKGIEGFDRWLAQDPESLREIFPWPKGIVGLRVRRKRLDRGPAADIFEAIRQDAEEKEDRMTYLLLRNGECLYRLWVDVDLWPRLFPSGADATAAHGGEDEWWSTKTDAQRRMKQQVAGLIALQGILERSTLLHPTPPGINVFDPTQEGEHFSLVRDGETVTALTDDANTYARVRWRSVTVQVDRPDKGPGCYDIVISEMGYQDWLKEQLTVGTRVFYTGRRWGGKDNSLEERTGHSRCEVWPDHGTPYTITGRSPRFYTGDLEFYYLPSDTVFVPNPDSEYRGDGELRARKRRLPFRCYCDEVVPIDFLSWRVLEHLLRDRAQRADYGDFFRIAFDWWKLAKTEAERERPFIDLVLHRCGAPIEEGPERARCERLMRWWKIKVKEHRTLSADEPKALRMIEAAFRRGDDHDNDPETLLFRARA